MVLVTSGLGCGISREDALFLERGDRGDSGPVFIAECGQVIPIYITQPVKQCFRIMLTQSKSAVPFSVSGAGWSANR